MFQQFNLNVTQFPTLFRWSVLPAAAPANKAGTPAVPKQKAAAPKLILLPGASTRKESWRRDGSISVTESVVDDLSPTVTNGFGEHDRIGWEEQSAYTQTAKGTQKSAPKDTQLCKYFQKGFCRFGNKCNFQHVPKGLDSSGGGNGNGVNGGHQAPSGPSSQFFSAPSSQAPPASSQASQARIDRSNISSILPTSHVPGFIPVNKSLKRLDLYMPVPSQNDWKKYNARFQQSNPCKAFHLQDLCATFPCSYDHSTLDLESKRVLEYVVKCNPCLQKGECRKDACIYGHVCQKDGCVGQGGHGAKGCKFKADLHYGVEDCKLASLVPEHLNGNGQGKGVGMESLEPLVGSHAAW